MTAIYDDYNGRITDQVGSVREGFSRPARGNAYKLIQTMSLDPDNKQGHRVYSPEGIGPNLSAHGGGLGAKTGLVEAGKRVRRLTPLECERLQGFPDGWTEGVSDTQRYRQMGNAVTVNVVEQIGRRLLEA